MPTFFWIIYILGFGVAVFAASSEIGDEPGGICLSLLIAVLWPVEVVFACVYVGVGLVRDRAHIRWPWQARTSTTADGVQTDGGTSHE
jgi:hypothetical protein